ncbi:unnamed protein product [Echinostoma caproni]|uniref:RRM domain-containing protein n=1 Tax=Echinostoma caproni TaxID=27848 RepID=A0A182ZZF7_9TREM|nr:unnamed protein product [Echinostoma caproni]
MSQQLHQKPQETIAFPMGSIALTTLHPATQGIPLPKIGTLIPNRIFVGGINSNVKLVFRFESHPSQTTEDELRSFFSVFGAIKDVKVIYDKSGLSKGSYGFVTFEDQETAEAIIKNEAETLIFKERKLNIGYAVRKQSAVCYPATVMISPNMGTHDLCTILSGTMHSTAQSMQHTASPIVKPGSIPCGAKGMMCSHLIPTTGSIPLGCTMMSNPSNTSNHSMCLSSGTCLATDQCESKTIMVDAQLNTPVHHHGSSNDLKQDVCLMGSKLRNSTQQTTTGRSSIPSDTIGSWLETQSSNPARQYSESVCPAVRHNSDSISHLFCAVGKDIMSHTPSIQLTENHLTAAPGSRAPMENMIITCCPDSTHTNTVPMITRSASFPERQPPVRMSMTSETGRSGAHLLQPDCLLRAGNFKESSTCADVQHTGEGSPSRIQIPNFELKLEPLIFNNINDRQEMWATKSQVRCKNIF